jgi:hypothetical protein
LVIVLQIFERRNRRVASLWNVIEEDLYRRLPSMSTSYLLPTLSFFSTFKLNHNLWSAFNQRILGEDSLTREEVLEVLRCYNAAGRVKTPVWTHIQDRFLIGKGYYMQMDLKELAEVEAWYKEANRTYNKEL